MTTPPAPAPWPAVRALLEQAQGLAPAACQALLADPALNAAVVAEVRSLLAHSAPDTRAGFLAQPAALASAVADAATADRQGQLLGAWRVSRPLGSGGMGEVWLAERADGSYSGLAAVKLLKRGMDSAAVLQRFALERQALARLSHPHIARLLDAGASAEGLPYFVMEFVDGKPIHEAALGLVLDERLRLFLQLADAVAYAHRNLLVHRDLKPGNVLVDGAGAVKLLDFGIAKALDPLEGLGSDINGQTTVGGVRPFTPHYASPEQVRGEPVTTATDIYSLGVLLYQMLTGARPTGRHATTAVEAARCVLEEEPTRPSRLSAAEAQDPQWLATRGKLEGDLDNILLKALDKSSPRRYASVDALAADITAYLEGRPVSARAASVGYVLSKFVQRNRWAALTVGVGGLGLLTALAATVLQGRTAAALGVLALAAGLLMALVQARQAALARDEAARARDDARLQLGRLKRITTDLVFRYGDTVSLLPGGAKAQEALLRASVASLEPALQGAPDDLDLVTTMVSALGRLAEIQGNTTVSSPASAADARATVTRALALAERAWPLRFADWRFASWHVRTLVVQAQGLRVQGRLQEAVDVLQRAAQRAQQALHQQSGGEGFMYTATGLANAQLTLAQLYDHANLPSLKRPHDALREYGLAEQVLRDLLRRTDVLEQMDRNAAPGDASSESYLQSQIGTILGGRALMHLQQEDLAAARVDIEAAMDLRRRVVAREPRLVIWRDGLMCEANTWAIVLLRQGEAVAALQASTLAWTVVHELAREEGAASKWAAPSVQAQVAAQHGRALAANARPQEALEVLAVGLRHWRCELDKADPSGHANSRRRVAWHQLQMAAAQAALGQAGAAVQQAQEALSALAALDALDAPPLASPLGRDVQLTRAEGHALLCGLLPDEAAAHRRAAVAALHAAQAWQPPGRLGPDHERLLAALQS